MDSLPAVRLSQLWAPGSAHMADVHTRHDQSQLHRWVTVTIKTVSRSFTETMEEEEEEELG